MAMPNTHLITTVPEASELALATPTLPPENAIVYVASAPTASQIIATNARIEHLTK